MSPPDQSTEPAAIVYIAIASGPGGVHVATSITASQANIGRPPSTAERVAHLLLGNTWGLLDSIVHAPASVPALGLLLDCIDPERFGHAVSDEVRRHASAVLAAAIPARFRPTGGAAHG